MAQDREDNAFHDPFKPQTPASAKREPQATEPGAERSDRPAGAGPDQPTDYEIVSPEEKAWLTPDFKVEGLAAASGGLSGNVRSLAAGLVGGVLLAVLVAILVMAFSQLFRDTGPDEAGPETPPPVPTVAVIEPALVVPLVSSGDVRLPVALPRRLTIGNVGFAVQAAKTAFGSWPDLPPTGDSATWAYGTFVNYILALAPTPENTSLLSGLQIGDGLSLHMSTGVIFNFNVTAKATAAVDEAAFFEQDIPRLTLALLTEDSAGRTVVSANFFGDEVADLDVIAKAAVGLFDTPVDQGQVRVTVTDAYPVAGAAAGLPSSAGYLLVDVKVENVGTLALEPTSFQTFLIDAAGQRFLPSVRAEPFAHYRVPTEALAPGQTLVGSFGYLIAGSPQGQFRWLFNPLPTSDNWVAVLVASDLPQLQQTLEAPVGSARVTLDASDVFVNRDDGLLDILLRIANDSTGVVQVTTEDVSLSSWTDGELILVAPAPEFPWVIEPGELRLFQLQFKLPTADSALLDVLGYSFSIEHLGGR